MASVILVLRTGYLYTVTLPLPVTTDVQNPSVRYVNYSVNLTCEFAKGSAAEGCLFNFTGATTQQSFFVNRNGDSPVASTCAIARAFANNTDYTWSASDIIGGVPIMVELSLVDEDNFECAPGNHYIFL